MSGGKGQIFRIIDNCITIIAIVLFKSPMLIKASYISIKIQQK